ncbi:MAG: ATP-binding protein [Candidatus Promineifilaceae bacterium]
MRSDKGHDVTLAKQIADRISAAARYLANILAGHNRPGDDEGEAREAESGEQVRLLELEIEERSDELALLNSFTTAISNKAFDTSSILDTAQNLLVQQLDIAGGGIFIYDPALDRLALGNSWGLPESFNQENQTLSVPGSFLEPVVRKKITLSGLDGQEGQAFQSFGLDQRKPGWRGFLAVPLLAEGDVEGVVCLFNTAPFNREQVAFFETLGGTIGIALYNARLFAEIRASREHLRWLARQVFSAQERERLRVSRELHDEAGQALTGLKFYLEMILADLNNQAQGANDEAGAFELELDSLRQQLRAAIDLCESTMGQIRLLAHDLRPVALESMGLNTTLRGYCRDFTRRSQLPVDYTGEEVTELPDAVGICLYRFLQEALTNAAKHANASRVKVTLHGDAQTVSLSVEDDGQGFDARSIFGNIDRGEGIGLAGMRERLEAVGGQLVIQSKAGSGSRLIGWVPR